MTKGFGADSTADDVLEGMDLSGKRVVVTGVSAGLGAETVRALVAHGASVVGAARDLNKARGALEAARAQAVNGAGIDLIELDLASLESVRRATDDLLAQGQPIDVLINNAGVMACPWGTTKDGFETQFGTNHLGHFVWTNRLTPLLVQGGRVVSLSSSAHRFGDIDLEDPNFERTEYKPWLAYGRSKTANALFAVALDRRLSARGSRATAVHPGSIQTELTRHLTTDLINEATGGRGFESLKLKTVPQGAATSLWSGLYAKGDEVGAKFCEDCHVAEVTDDPKSPKGVRRYALDPAQAEALWTLSEEMVGERFAYS